MSRGFTLVEMVVTVLILGLLTAMSGLALRSMKPGAEQELIRRLADARAQAIRSGRAVVWHEGGAVVRFLPNGSSSGGRVSAEGVLVMVDPLTGVIHEPR